jgi:uncharacterized protein (DUF433 family)
MDIEELVSADPEIVSGTPVFKGTRVPVETIFHYLKAGDPLDEFLDDFPTVSREQAIALLEALRLHVLREVPAKVPQPR